MDAWAASLGVPPLSRRLAAIAAAIGLRLAVPVTLLLLFSGPGIAETLPNALIRAYQGNPQLNAERAKLRATDEGVPVALSGYRPQLIATLSTGLQGVRNLLPDNTQQSSLLKPWTVGFTVSQTLFNGFKTANSVRQAEAQVRSGREALRNVGQGVLLDAVTAYINVLGNQTLVEVQRANTNFLRETLGSTRRRLDLGDVTPTDVAQAEARLNRALADQNNAEVGLAISQAMYEQVIGAAPSRLVAGAPIDRLLPRSRESAVEQAMTQHPVILAAGYDIDVAQSGVGIAESSLWPNISVQGTVSRSVQTDTTLGTTRTDEAGVLGTANVPLYDGGLAAAQTRQAKELVAQARTILQQVRNQTRTAVISAWASYEGSRISVSASEAEARAADVALSGVQKEAQAGQRTTLDVLNAQQDLIGARARLVQAQHDREISAYTLLSAVGQLDVKHLGLNTPDYLPEVHYQQVRDAWHGLRTPSGQ